MKMRREVLGDQAREAFMQHFAELSAELPQVERDGTVELVKDGRVMGKYAFTTIENMDVILRPLLAKHGFAISFASIDNKGDSVTITGTLSGWGWERSSTYTLPPDTGPGRNALQARGSLAALRQAVHRRRSLQRRSQGQGRRRARRDGGADRRDADQKTASTSSRRRRRTRRRSSRRWFRAPRGCMTSGSATFPGF